MTQADRGRHIADGVVAAATSGKTAGMSRRQFTGLGLGAAGSLLLAACGGSSSGAKSGSLALYNNVAVWKDGWSAAGKRLKRKTDFDFTVRSISQPNAYEQLIKTSIRTKKTADIAKWQEGYPLQDLARSGQLTDLSDVWDEVQDKKWVQAALRSQFSYDDTVYALPLVRSYWPVFYNKKLFAKAGVEPPSTYEEFLEVAAELKKSGTTPMWTGQGDGWPPFVPYTLLVTAQDPSFYSKLTSNKASYTDEVSRRALDLWKNWIDKKWVTAADSKVDDAAPLMRAGKVAMIPLGTWYNGSLKKAGLKPGEDYGAFLFPPIDDAPHALFVESSGLIVPKNAPNHAGAMKQIRAWLDPSVQRGWSDYLGDNSPNITVEPKDPVLKEVDAAVRATKARALPRYFEASPPNLISGNIEDLGKFMIDPSDARGVLDSMQKRATTEWKAWEANR